MNRNRMEFHTHSGTLTAAEQESVMGFDAATETAQFQHTHVYTTQQSL